MIKNTKNKTVSIIIPMYNAQLHIEECLESVIHQTYDNLDIVIIDDGSIDNSFDICLNYAKKDKRINLLRKQNGGVSSARNMGIINAAGEYITFVDSDDVLDLKYIEILVKNANKDQLTICKYQTYKSEYVAHSNHDYDFICYPKSELLNLYRFKLLNCPCCKLYSKKIIINNQLFFNENYSLGEDLLFNLDYYQYVKSVRILNIDLYFYRRESNNSLSAKYIKNMKDIHYELIKRVKLAFETTTNYKLLNAFCTDYMIVVLDNEFRNGPNSLIKNYARTIKILRDPVFKKELKSYYVELNKLSRFLLSANLYLSYKIYNRLFHKRNKGDI